MSPLGANQTLVEIIGVAGSGKSSLARALEGQGYFGPPFISASNPRHLAVMLRSLPRLWLLVAHNLIRRPRFSWADFKLMAYITGWRQFLGTTPGLSASTLVFDQGPLYALGRLEAKGLGIASTRTYERWWREMLRSWAAEISLIVWVDATNEKLLERINERPQDHAIKGLPTDDGIRFIDHYRTVFNRLLALVEKQDASEIARFDTTTLDTDRLAQLVGKLVRNHSSQ